MDIHQMLTRIKDLAVPLAVTFGSRLLGAIALWIIGRIIISLIRRAVQAGATRRHVDPTISRYLDSTLNLALQILLVIALLGMFGVETASFAGVLAAVGVAIGMAWSGLLSNFAAGLFMLFLRPFKIGDMITVAGVTGDVQEVGMFVTCLHTADNIRTYIGNAKILSDTIQNYTANPCRRVELTAQLAHEVDPRDAIRRLKARLITIPHVAKEPAPQVELLSFNLAGPVLAVRPFTHNSTYWDVYFATNLAIAEEFAAAGYPVPATHLHNGVIAVKPGDVPRS
jgi:small conductance mechanosensitive channel